MDADSWDKIEEPGYLKNVNILIFFITLENKNHPIRNL